MMQYKNEIQILNIVKFIPPLFIVILSVITLSVIYFEHQSSFEKEKKEIESEFIHLNKSIIQNQVNTVVDFINEEYHTTESKLKQSIKQRVNEAHHLAISLYEKNKDKPLDEVKRLIIETLREIRFNDNRGYFFINDMNGFNILHPLFPQLENTNILKLQNKRGDFLIQGMTQKLQNSSEAFHEWYWHKGSDTKADFKKVGFLKKFEPFNWYIGTAEYFDDFEALVQKDVLERIAHFKYEKSGYIFIFHEDGTYLSHPRKSSLGKNIYASKGIIDEKGKVVVKEAFDGFKQLAQNGGGFYTYIQASKPLTKKPALKIAYIQGISNWHWVVGKGFYADEIQVVLDKKKERVNEEFQNHLKKIVLVTLLLLIFLLVISLFFSRIIEGKFAAYKKEIKNYLDENTKQQNMLAQQSKMAAMGEMIGNIAHQWRQPLSIISTAVTGMKVQQQLNVLEPKELNESCDAINKSVQHLSQTIDDFRDFFKPNKDKNIFNLKDVVQRSIKLVSAQFVAKEISVVTQLDNIYVNGYEREVVQVLINILNNAKDALVDIKSKKYIFIKVYAKKSQAIIEIKDNAGGIPKDILQKVFEPYFTTKHQSQGTGIGLYMSKEIIEKHMDGSLCVRNDSFEYESGQYKGALFTVTLSQLKKEHT